MPSFGPLSLRIRSGLLPAVLALWTLACSGGGGGNPPPPPSPDFTLSVANPPAIQAGSGGSTAATVARSNGHSAAIALSVAANAAGITGTGGIPVSGTGGTLTLTVPLTAAAGTSALTVNASDGSLTRSASLAVTVTPGPDFTLSVTAPGPVPAGASIPVAVTATRSNGHTAAITLSLATNAQGITGAGSIAVSAAGGDLSLAVPVVVAPGSYSLNCTGSDGSLSRSVPFNLTVTPPAGFTLGLGAGNASAFLAGSTPSIPLTLNRVGGYAAPVTFTVEGLPAGVIAQITPATTTGSSAALLLTASASATIGQTNLTVRAVGGGQPDQVAILALTVSPRPPTPMSVGTWINATKTNASYAAWRNGRSGPWTTLAGTGGVYGFTVTDPAGLFTVVLSYNGDARVGPQIRVINGSVGEMKRLAAPAAADAEADIEEGFGEGGEEYQDESGAPTSTVTATLDNVVSGGYYHLGCIPEDPTRRPLVQHKSALGISVDINFSLLRPMVVKPIAIQSGVFNGVTPRLTVGLNQSITGTSAAFSLDFNQGLQGTPLAIPVDTSALGMTDISMTQAELCLPGAADSPGWFMGVGGGGGNISTFTWPATSLPPGCLFRADAIGSSSDWSRNAFHTQFYLPGTPSSPALATPPVPILGITQRLGDEEIRVSATYRRSRVNPFTSLPSLHMAQSIGGGRSLYHKESFSPQFLDLFNAAPGQIDLRNTRVEAPSSRFGSGAINFRLEVISNVNDGPGAILGFHQIQDLKNRGRATAGMEVEVFNVNGNL